MDTKITEMSCKILSENEHRALSTSPLQRSSNGTASSFIEVSSMASSASDQKLMAIADDCETIGV